MSDDICTGYISKLTNGKFDNQFNVEITRPDGTLYTQVDGVSVNDLKKDGTPTKVFPMIKDSYANETHYTWQGNFKESQTQGGPKTYATITWAQKEEAIAPGVSGSVSTGDWSVPSVKGEVAAEPSPSLASPPQPQSTPPSQSSDWDDRTYEIEAAWAVKAVLDARPELFSNFAELMQQAKHLIGEKRRLAGQLKNSPGATPTPTSQTQAGQNASGAVAGEAKAVSSQGDGTPAPSFAVLVTAIGFHQTTQAAVIKAAREASIAHGYTHPQGFGWAEVENAPEPVLRDVIATLGLGMAAATV